MVWTTKSFDNRRLPEIWITPINNGILGQKQKIAIGWNVGVIGSDKTCTYIKGGKFKPGVIKTSPINHRENVSSCASTFVKTLYPQQGGLKPNYIFEGDLAAYFGYPKSLDLGPTLEGDISALSADLMYSAYSSIVQPDLDVGMNVAESAQTLRMLVSPITALSGALRKLRRPRTVGAYQKRSFKRKNLKKMPSTALEYARDAWLVERYGILPLVYDIQAGLKLAKVQLEDSPYKCAHEFGRLQSPAIVSDGYEYWNGVYFGYIRRVSVDARASARVYYRYKHSTVEKTTKLGIDVKDIPYIAYQLIPYSFVVDWWLDVGSWLKLVTHASDYEVLGHCQGLSSEITHSYTLTWATAYPFDVKAKVPCNGTFVRRQKLASRVNNYILPTLPRLNVNLQSWKHAVDSVALIWQKLPKLPH